MAEGGKCVRKKNELVRDVLLECAHQIAAAEGADAINIRRLATQAGVASGTVYNYFQSKEDVLLALTEECWRKALVDMQAAVRADTFKGQLAEMYAFLRARMADSADMLMQSLSEVEAAGRDRMQRMHQSLSEAIARRIAADTHIRADVWDERFTRERYADFVLMNLLMLLQKKADTIDFFLDILQRTLY